MNKNLAAFDILVSNRTEKQKEKAFQALLAKPTCSECDGQDLDDNGCRGVDLTILCNGCGHQWSPNEC